MVSNIKDMRSAYMIKEKVINNPKLLGVRVAKYLRVSRRCPNSKFQIRTKLLHRSRSITIPWAWPNRPPVERALREHEASTQRAWSKHSESNQTASYPRSLKYFVLFNLIPSFHMVYVKKVISLFCDHKEIRNSLIGVGVKCFVLTQVGGGLGCQRLINDTRWLVTMTDKASLSRYSNAACPAWTCIYFKFTLLNFRSLNKLYQTCSVFIILYTYLGETKTSDILKENPSSSYKSLRSSEQGRQGTWQGWQ